MNFHTLYVDRPSPQPPLILVGVSELEHRAWVEAEYGPVTWFDDLVMDKPWLYAEAPHGHRAYISRHELPSQVCANPSPWYDLTAHQRRTLLPERGLSKRTYAAMLRLYLSYRREFLCWLLEQQQQGHGVTLPEQPGPWSLRRA
jgi:hypothetical protein